MALPLSLLSQHTCALFLVWSIALLKPSHLRGAADMLVHVFPPNASLRAVGSEKVEDSTVLPGMWAVGLPVEACSTCHLLFSHSFSCHDAPRQAVDSGLSARVEFSALCQLLPCCQFEWVPAGTHTCQVPLWWDSASRDIGIDLPRSVEALGAN